MDSHSDKYNDPRARITRRGVLAGLLVFVCASIVAGLSIYARKTPLEKTTQFWGPETITALQLAERVQLLPCGNERFDPVELTTTPGLGHLRRALLDERNFNWESVQQESVSQFWTSQPEAASTAVTVSAAETGGTNRAAGAAVDSDKGRTRPEASKDGPQSVRLRLTDPTAHRIDAIEIDLDLVRGWVGPKHELGTVSSSAEKRVEVRDHVRPKLRNYFKTVIHFQPKRYEDRP